jgi:hypothetical protein
MKEITKEEFEILMEKYEIKARNLVSDPIGLGEYNHFSISEKPVSMVYRKIPGNWARHKESLSLHYSRKPCSKIEKHDKVICLGWIIENGDPVKWFVDFHRVGQCKFKEKVDVISNR